MSHQNQLKAARNPGRIDIKGRVAISVRRLTVYGTLQKNALTVNAASDVVKKAIGLPTAPPRRPARPTPHG